MPDNHVALLPYTTNTTNTPDRHGRKETKT